jgi:hypothetical protein
MIMNMGGRWLSLGLLLLSGWASAQGCLGGTSTQATCVQSGGIYGQGSDQLNNELLQSDSAASTLQGKSANQILHSDDSSGAIGPGSGKSFLPAGKGQSRAIKGALAKRMDKARKAGIGGHGSSRDSSNTISAGGGTNSLGEREDYFGGSAERDVHGHLTTCLHDSFGHQVCM